MSLNYYEYSSMYSRSGPGDGYRYGGGWDGLSCGLIEQAKPSVGGQGRGTAIHQGAAED